MANLDAQVVRLTANRVSADAARMIEAHVDANPTRYRCPTGISAAQIATIRLRLRHEFQHALSNLEIEAET